MDRAVTFYIINRSHMKLQIMGRLNKKQKYKHDNLKDILQGGPYFTQESLMKGSRVQESWNIRTEETVVQGKEEKDSLRGFFENFEELVEVRYEAVEDKSRKIKRKLAPVLEMMKESAKSKQSRVGKDKKSNKENSRIEGCLKENTKVGNKVRKANSLLNIERPSTAKPHKTKLDKSISRKDSSLRSSKLSENKENHDPSLKPKSKASKFQSKRSSKDIQRSKEWITHMLRQINEIYEIRKPETSKLR